MVNAIPSASQLRPRTINESTGIYDCTSKYSLWECPDKMSLAEEFETKLRDPGYVDAAVIWLTFASYGQTK